MMCLLLYRIRSIFSLIRSPHRPASVLEILYHYTRSTPTYHARAGPLSAKSTSPSSALPPGPARAGGAGPPAPMDLPAGAASCFSPTIRRSSGGPPPISCTCIGLWYPSSGLLIRCCHPDRLRVARSIRPWPGARARLAPLGHRPGPDRASLVLACTYNTGVAPGPRRKFRTRSRQTVC